MKEVPFEVAPGPALKVTATLNGRKCEITVRLPVIAVVDDEADVVEGGRTVPAYRIQMAQPVCAVQVLGEDPPPPAGLVGGKPN